MYLSIRKLRPGLVPALIALAFSGAVLSQTFRLAEEIPLQANDAARHYSVVLDCGFDAPPPAEPAKSKTASSHPEQKQNKTVLVVKPLTDHWEVCSGVHFDCADLPPDTTPLVDCSVGTVPVLASLPWPYLTYRLPCKFSTGPPSARA